jgi:hypothetical protein
MKFSDLPENLRGYVLSSNYFGPDENGDLKDDRDGMLIADLDEIYEQIAWDAENRRELNTDDDALDIADHVGPEVEKFLTECPKITTRNGKYVYEDGNFLTRGVPGGI